MTNTVAAIQLSSQDNLEANLQSIDSLVANAKNSGAKLALLPENCAYMGKSQGDSKSIAEPLGDGATQQFFASVAAKHNIWLITGAFPIIDNGQLYQTLLVYNDKGELVTHYHKRHLFNVTLPNGGTSYRESDAFTAGNEIKLIDTPVGRIGLAICYDLRFPEHFRELVKQGATTLVLPAAFTHSTGKAHWEVLLRARAIENQCYIIASGQTGTHPDNRQTWGHSMIINPWGEILSTLDKDQGVTTADIDMDLLASQREVFPALTHRL